MSRTTGINWCDATFNPWIGCSKISAGCANCYAEAQNRIHKWTTSWGPGAPRKTMADSNWVEPLKWEREAKESGNRLRVFCSSLADWCDDKAPVGQLSRLWELIRQTPHLDWLLLTKRADRIEESLPDDWSSGYRNVWLGTTVEDRSKGLPRIDRLRWIPAVCRFVSAEPLLEDLGEINLSGISRVIVGGESGDRTRTFRPEWAESIKIQCRDQGVAFWCKQMGASVEYLGKPVQLIDINKEGVERPSRNGEDWTRWPAALGHLKLRELPILSDLGPAGNQSHFHEIRIRQMDKDLGKLAVGLDILKADQEQGFRQRFLKCERGLFISRLEKAAIISEFHELYSPLRLWSEFCRIAGVARQTSYDLLQLVPAPNCTESVQSPSSATTKPRLTVEKAVKEAVKRVERVFKELTEVERTEAVRLLFSQLNPVHNSELEEAA